jgi:hypothetical protein
MAYFIFVTSSLHVLDVLLQCHIEIEGGTSFEEAHAQEGVPPCFSVLHPQHKVPAAVKHAFHIPAPRNYLHEASLP